MRPDSFETNIKMCFSEGTTIWFFQSGYLVCMLFVVVFVFLFLGFPIPINLILQAVWAGRPIIHAEFFPFEKRISGI